MKNSRNVVISLPFSVSLFSAGQSLKRVRSQALKMETHASSFSFWTLTSNLIQSQGSKQLFPSSLSR